MFSDYPTCRLMHPKAGVAASMRTLPKDAIPYLTVHLYGRAWNSLPQERYHAIGGKVLQEKLNSLFEFTGDLQDLMRGGPSNPRG